MVVLALWAVAKRLLPSAMDVIVRRLEHAHTRELTQLESRIQAQTASLVNSMDIASRISASYRDKTIASVELLWRDILHIERTFASLVAVVSILTKEEFLSAIKDPTSCSTQTREALAEFVPEGKLERVLLRQREEEYSPSGSSIGLGLFPHYLHETRPFVREATFSRYSVFTSVYGRLAYLVRSGTKSGEPEYWTDDPIMSEIVSNAIPYDKWLEIRALGMSGFAVLVENLNWLFIEEAKKDMRGTDNLAESAAEVGRIYRVEEARRLDGEFLA